MRYEDYIDEEYEPQEKDLVCDFRFEHDPSVSFEWAAGGIAAESSIGTWAPDLATMYKGVEDFAAKVFWTDKEKDRVKIAYPQKLFEPGNISQIQSSITGNIFGLDELTRLKVLDVDFTKDLIDSFPGPQLGISGIRGLTRVKDRPLVGTIVKPKLGLSYKQHAEVAYNAWVGGLDIVKDDENLTDIDFNKYRDRIPEALEKRDQAEEETGEKKLYLPNVTAPAGEMKRRAGLAIDYGCEYVMIDILTAGWSALQEMREYLEGKKVGIHAHRAQHAVYIRLKRHGISMLLIAKFARLVGVDNLHAGTVVGKMEGEKQEVLDIYEHLRDNLRELNRVIPVASGGLHPALVGDLVDMFGTELVIQAGGGVHGHPEGTRKGAAAMRQAVEAVMEGVELEEAAKEKTELAKALEKWS